MGIFSRTSASQRLLFLILLSAFVWAAIGKTFPGDIAALAAVKQAVDPSTITPGSCLSSWDFAAADPCDASFGQIFTCGFRCETTDSFSDLSRVTELSLDAAGYSGSLSPAVWSLSALESLDIADNHFTGSIPPPPPSGLPSTLRRITLSRNYFTSALPTLAPASGLEELFFDNNQLTGYIPSSFSELRSLKRLELQGNGLAGGLPNFSNLSSFYYLDASNNSLSGGFPATLPSSLVEIILRNNKLDGQLHGETVSALPAVQVMDLSNNMLSGSIPAAAFQHPALEQLSLAGNMLDFLATPVDGGVSSQLIALDLGHNKLTGMLPMFIGAMPRLSAVTLEYNRFTGIIPAAYVVRTAGVTGGAAQFERLLLAGNYLFGPVPSEWGNLNESSAVISIADNCMYRCPSVLLVCEDGRQKSSTACRQVSPVIP